MTEALSPTELGVPAGAVVLDIGCADGVGSVRIAEHGYFVFGVELETHLLASMRERASTARLAACQGDATALPIADGSVDAAVLIEVLEHIPDTKATLAEVARVVRPGGKVCIAVPTDYTERLYDRLHPRYVNNAEHIHRFDRDELDRLLAAAGIRVERVATRNLAPALAWLIHALMRTDADPTGRVLRNEWIDKVVAGGLRILRLLPLVRHAVRLLESRVGKSLVFLRCRYLTRRPTCRTSAPAAATLGRRP